MPARAELGYDEDGKWESLMDEMADAQYMDAKLEFIDYPKLAGAVNERLPTPFTFDEFLAAESEGTLEEYPVAVVARALSTTRLRQQRPLKYVYPSPWRFHAPPRRLDSRTVFPSRPLPWTRPCASSRWPRASRRRART